jgi:hypothetical protein
VPDGTVAGLALITWAVLGSWLVLGWRTVAVESAAGMAVDNRGHPATRGCGQPGAPPCRRLRSPPGGLTPAGVSLACPGTRRRQGTGRRPLALVSLRVALGLPDRGPEGRILVVAARTGPVGFLVDEVVRVLRYDPAACPPETTRLSGYVTASFQALGASWLLIDWDAIRLPTGITAPR